MDVLQYDFMQRALLAGLIIAGICPLIGAFVVIRRQSFIGDGLGHIAFAGVTGSYVVKVYPLIGALLFTVAGALGIEYLRRRHSQFADMGLALIFYAGMALAVIFSTLIRIPSAGLLGFLFGSILTVTSTDLWVIALCGIIVSAVIYKYFHALMFTTLDEEAAFVAGVNTNRINIVFSVMTALVVVIGISVAGALLVSALMVVPVASAHLLNRGFTVTLAWAVGFSLCSVLGGLLAAYQLDIAPGGAIVMLAITIYAAVLGLRQLPFGSAGG